MSKVAGLWISLLLVLPLMAVLFVAERAAGLPFPAFDLMDFLTRNLPGDLITWGIDSMVDLIIALGLGDDLDTTAKTAEQLMAALTFGALGALIGWLYALGVRRVPNFMSTEYATGLLMGMVVGAGLALVSASYNQSATTSPFINTVWLMGALMAWGAAHNWVQRYLYPKPTPAASITPPSQILDRRQFLIRVGAASATITVVGAGLGALLGEREIIVGANLGAVALGDGLQPAPGTRPEYTPLQDHYRIDINTGRPPNVDPLTYQLRLMGLVDEEVRLSLDQIRAYEPLHQFITLSCISNRIAGRLISTTRWTGVPMKTLLADVPLKPEATHIKIFSLDGFFEIVALDDIMNDERIMLTYEWDGVPLPEKHGYPLRIYLPDRYGMKQPKWISRMEFISAWEPGYWVVRNWSRDAFVRTTSVIDTIAADAAFEQNGKTFIPIGGIAYAGARGISKVEVRVDDGEWQETQLRDPLSPTTWVIWRLDWAFEPGEHTFTVRAFENDGTAQITEENPTRPDGATGLHSQEEHIRV